MSKKITLFLIVLVGLFLRLYGINFGLPFIYHADEPIVVNHAMAYGLGDLNPHFYAIPPLTSYILFAMYVVYFIIGRGVHVFSSTNDFGLSFLSDPTAFYLIGRIFIGVLLGTLTILAVYLIARKLFSEKVGIISALFMAVAFIHVQNSHYIYADIPTLLFIVLTCIPALGIIRNGNIKNYILAGTLAGIATAFKYNSAIIFLPIAIAHFINYRMKYKARLAAAFIAMVSGFIVCNPFSILDMPNFINGIIKQSGAEYPLGVFHHMSYSLVGGLGPVLIIFGLFGMFYYAVKDPKTHLVFISFPIIFYIILSFFSQAHERYVLPLTPFFIVYAVAIIDEFIKNRLLIFIIVSLVVIPNIAKSGYSDYLFSQEDTRTLARKWVEDNIPSGARIAIEHSFFCPRLNQTKKQIEEKLSYNAGSPAKDKRILLALKLADRKEPSYYLYYLKEKSVVNTGFLFERPQLSFSMPEIHSEKIDYVIMHVDTKKDTQEDFYRELLNNATPVKEFSPYKNKDTQYALDLTIQTGGPFLGRELFARERNGYIIKIFKVKGI